LVEHGNVDRSFALTAKFGQNSKFLNQIFDDKFSTAYGIPRFNSDSNCILVSVLVEHLIMKTLPSSLEISAIVALLIGTSSLPLFRYLESQKEDEEDQKPLIE